MLCFNFRLYLLNNSAIEIDRKTRRRSNMEIFNKIKSAAKSMTEVGVGLIALAIVLEVLFKGQAIPFLGNMNVIGNISGIVKSFSADGLVGLVAMYVLYSIYKKG